MPSSITAIIPALNEAKSLAAAVDTVYKATAGLVSKLEIIIVDDASTDSTGAIADRLAAKDRRVKVVHNKTNMGLGYNYRKGVELASNEYVIMIPGDNENSAPSIRPIVEQLGDADIVIPYVTNPEVRPLTRRVISRAFVLSVNILCGLKLRYYNGTCAIRREAVASVPLDTQGFAYMAATLVRLLKSGCSYTEVGVPLDRREHGPSKAFKPRNILRVGKTVFALFWEVRMLRKRAKRSTAVASTRTDSADP